MVATADKYHNIEHILHLPVRQPAAAANYLEGAAECDNVRVEHGSKDFTLRPDIVTMVSRQDALLAHNFHGIHLACALAAHLEHLHIERQSVMLLPVPGLQLDALSMQGASQASTIAILPAVTSACSIRRNGETPELQALTFPKAPWPTTLSSSKSEGPSLVGL